MINIQQDVALADRIGRDRIAMVVGRFYDAIRSHDTLATPFASVANWDEHKEQLTYFWWIALGGKKHKEVNFNVVVKHRKAGFSAPLLKDWLTLFRLVVFSILDEKLAEEWMEKAFRLGNSLLLSDESFRRKLEHSIRLELHHESGA